MSTNHTPLPWDVGEDIGKARRCIVTSEARDVCTCETYYGDDEANAEFIVRAVNSHDEMLAVATELASWTENPSFRLSPRLLNLIDRARAAIAAAEGREA